MTMRIASAVTAAALAPVGAAQATSSHDHDGPRSTHHDVAPRTYRVQQSRPGRALTREYVYTERRLRILR